jgi:putative SOS response-associated peptidase YedK
MCARITLTTTDAEGADLFGLAYDLGAERTSRAPAYNVAPSRRVPVVRSVGGKPELASLAWGLVPNWSKKAQGYPTARAESVATKPAFRSTIRSRRCVVPIDGFYEWETVGTAKQPHYFRRAGGGVLAVAGVWDAWAGREMETVAILTVPANDAVRPYHPRMPAILEPGQFGAWLGGTLSDALALLKPCPVEVLETWPVSRAVNSVKAEGEGLLRPVTLSPRQVQPSLFGEAA